jgi:NADP-dependent 3-hydroxy acid dehydrogenase YdfG
MNRTAVVTGASSGIGEATARRLAAEGFDVVAAARRRDRLDRLAAEVPGIRAATLDVTSQESVDEFAASLDRCDVLINNAGGAVGLEPVASGDLADWQQMYDVNVLGTLRVTQALLPRLIDSGDGVLLMLTSVAGLVSYEGGGGYNAAKFAQHALTGALRLEEAEHNLRVIEVAPGLVQTEEFALNRLGDQDAAAKVYQGVEKPLTAADVADVVRYAVVAPHHINLDQIVIRPVAQAANYKLIRKSQ